MSALLFLNLIHMKLQETSYLRLFHKTKTKSYRESQLRLTVYIHNHIIPNPRDQALPRRSGSVLSPPPPCDRPRSSPAPLSGFTVPSVRSGMTPAGRSNSNRHSDVIGAVVWRGRGDGVSIRKWPRCLRQCQFESMPRSRENRRPLTG